MGWLWETQQAPGTALGSGSVLEAVFCLLGEGHIEGCAQFKLGSPDDFREEAVQGSTHTSACAPHNLGTAKAVETSVLCSSEGRAAPSLIPHGSESLPVPALSRLSCPAVLWEPTDPFAANWAERALGEHELLQGS